MSAQIAAQTARTPGPWEVTSKGQCTTIAQPGIDGQVVANLRYGDDMDRANAAFIVHACNAHDDLVAALKDMLRIAKAASIGVAGNVPRIARAEAALAKAGAL